jgi:hypothetical protein
MGGSPGALEAFAIEFLRRVAGGYAAEGDFSCGEVERVYRAVRKGVLMFFQRVSAKRVKPSALHSSLPMPWWTKKRPAGSYFFFTAANRR